MVSLIIGILSFVLGFLTCTTCVLFLVLLAEAEALLDLRNQ
jgi:hypothetical protein